MSHSFQGDKSAALPHYDNILDQMVVIKNPFDVPLNSSSSSEWDIFDFLRIQVAVALEAASFRR